jgi:hypothetical protein
MAAYWDDIKAAVSGVSGEQEKLNALAQKNVEASNANMEALNASDNILRQQGLTEREILQLKIKGVDAQIKALEVSMKQSENTFKAQYDAEKRNREILKGILMFTQAPLLLILKTIDEIAAFAGMDTNLAEGLLDFESSFLFDEGKVKENYEKTRKENEKTLLNLKNTKAGLEEDIKKIDKQAAEERKRLATQALADAKDNAAARLAAQRELEDANLALMDEGIEKELQANKLKYDRLVEDTKLNEKMTASEKKKINEAYEKEREQQVKVIEANDKKRQEEKKKEEEAAAKEKAQRDREAAEEKYATEKLLQDKTISLMKEGLDKEKALREQAYKDELHELENLLLDKKITQEQFTELQVGLEKKKNDDIAQLEADAAQESKEKQIEKAQDTISNLQSVLEFGSEAINAAVNGTLSGVSAFLDILNTDFADGLQGTMDKISAYAQAIGGVLQSFVSAFQESSKEALETSLGDIETQTSAEKDALKSRYDAGLVAKEDYEAGLSSIDQVAKAKEQAARKKAFEQEKGAKIASAIISGIQGAVQAFTGAMQLGPIAGPIVGGVLAALVVAMTATNVAKIKATQFEAGGAGGGSATAPTLGSDTGMGAAPTPPSLSIQGGAMGGSEGAGLQLFGARQTPVRSYVVESDITGTQDRLQSYQQRAEIG